MKRSWGSLDDEKLKKLRKDFPHLFSSVSKRKKPLHPSPPKKDESPASDEAVRFEFSQHHGKKANNLCKTVTYNTPASIFPPVLYTNVEYSQGPCLTQQTIKGDQVRVKLPPNYMKACYNQPNFPYSPVLPQPHLWSHKFAATESAKLGFPLNVLRLLGSITRTVTAKKEPTVSLDQRKIPVRRVDTTATRYKLPKTQAKKQVLLDHPEMSPEQMDAKVQEIQAEWSENWSNENLPKYWCEETGDLLPSMLNDDAYVPLHDIMEWDFAETRGAPKSVELYHGLKTVEVDLPSVLHSLAELQSPKGLYGIPLLVAYPRVFTAKVPPTKVKSKKVVFQVQIGIYAQRLLPEVLSERDLLMVMSALDSGSYRISEDLHIPPVPSKPTFKSAEYPKLIFDVHDEEKRKTTFKTEAKPPQDVALVGSTRTTDDTLSAFTVPGLLKLWESTGSDVSEWPKLEKKLQGKLTMDLLLHQQHALCWMKQMEGLGGFGINSILWQEREWADGGMYYYSPALGQLRLERPTKMHGGLICDEMGLGKTIMILALVTVTLEELKRDSSRSHSTLIIVPPVLLGQWKQEIKKAAPQLSVQVYNARISEFDPPKTEFEDCPADIVLTTYQALQETKIARPLQQRSWGRIVLDEMQEIRSSTTAIAISCNKLDGNRRWMLSGTPLFEGIDDLRGELNFLSLLPFGAKNEDGFFDFSVTSHWNHHSKYGLDTLQVLGLLLLRRSKAMKIIRTNRDLMGLKPLTLEFVPVSQTPSERAIYCFLEHVVANELRGFDTTDASQRLCLRLLRELCISPVLLTGGLGVSSALAQLNNLLVFSNRREYERSQRNTKGNPDKAISCSEAIRYLSQVQSKVQTKSDYVSDLHLGVGGGIAKRNRATESVSDRLEECKTALMRAKKEVRDAQSNRAKAHWHWALERVTTGHISPPTGTKKSIAAVWRWRATLRFLHQDSTLGKKQLNSFLLRGWRPSTEFLETGLQASHPEFAWAHPWALTLTNIPRGVQPSEVHRAIAKALQTNCHQVVPVSDRKRAWKAILQLQNSEDAKTLGNLARKGVPLMTKAKVPFLQEMLREARAAYKEIRNENEVHPTNETGRQLKLIEKDLERAKRGLIIVFDDDSETQQIQLSRARGPPRSLRPETSQLLYASIDQTIEESDKILATNVAVLSEKTKLLRNIERASEVPDEVRQMSSFESLEAMAEKDYKKTFCAICLGVLGSSDPKSTDEAKPGMVALTSCGHLFCEKCIADYMQQTTASYRQPQCPTCRKDINKSNLVYVDPSLSDVIWEEEIKQRTKAKTVIKQAAQMLEKSNGQLNPELWLQLYLSIDVPDHVSQRGDFRLSAIPKELVAFFRAATGFSEIHNKVCALPDIEPLHGLSSKAHALVRDLPKGERSVVFTSSRTAVKHLLSVFEYHKIGFRALFSGQQPSEAELAVQDWKDTDLSISNDFSEPRVLIVQSGAAASGLTLTAACKMFFLEPFIRQEEEQQAYARCHRFGQEDEVNVKVYFTPVSVESRLLEWRKLTSSTTPSDTKVVFTDMWEMMDSCEEDILSEEEERDGDSDVEDSDQTLFLLGLKQS